MNAAIALNVDCDFMSNKVTIQRTLFTNLPSGEKTFGYRMYDDHGQTYCNTLAGEDMNLTDEEFLAKIVDGFDNVANAMFDFALERGIFIGDNHYTFNLDSVYDNGWRLVKPS
jgi:hypothetical protein